MKFTTRLFTNTQEVEKTQPITDHHFSDVHGSFWLVVF